MVERDRRNTKVTYRIVLYSLDLGFDSICSPRDRLFGLSSGVYRFSAGLLEKTCDGILNAAKTGDLVELKQLHEQGYSLLSIDANGQTALHLASRHGHKEVVRYLIACAPPTIMSMIDNDK